MTKRGTFKDDDVTLLLTDITGLLQPKPAAERERLIQSGTHYSAMLPLEEPPSAAYLAEYYHALAGFARETATATRVVAEKIYAARGAGVVLVSLARAGTPIGILLRRYLRRCYGAASPHYTISIVRGRGIDKHALRYILARHPAEVVQFVDGWTGKGAILRELEAAAAEFFGPVERRRLLAVLADPANVTDLCGTHEDFPIASSFLNATVCGLMSRTVIRPGLGQGSRPDEWHGVAFFEELRAEDRTYEFIERVESYLTGADSGVAAADSAAAHDDSSGLAEVTRIAREFAVADINFVKPGIGEATRVLLRRVPDAVLVAAGAPERYIAHIRQLAAEKRVPVITYPLRRYRACGIIKNLAADL